MKTPIYGSKPEQTTAAKFKMNDGMMEPEVAYQIVHDEVMLDGNARLNLATFVTTYMDEYATRLMVETLDKNMIDKTEYPQTAEIERRCVNILADLWNSPEAASG
ncbi:MAG: pyridoxal-dependent decarboxylase, partial [Mucinivorans sp.]